MSWVFILNIFQQINVLLHLPDGPNDGPWPGSPVVEFAEPDMSPANAGGKYADMM